MNSKEVFIERVNESMDGLLKNEHINPKTYRLLRNITLRIVRKSPVEGGIVGMDVFSTKEEDITFFWRLEESLISVLVEPITLETEVSYSDPYTGREYVTDLNLNNRKDRKWLVATLNRPLWRIRYGRNLYKL